MKTTKTPHPMYTAHPKFYLKNGDLTVYALACGYCQRFDDIRNAVSMELYKSGVYQVKGYDFANHNRLFWHSLESLSEARRVFRKEVTNYKRGLKTKGKF